MPTIRPANLIFEAADREGNPIWLVPELSNLASSNLCAVKDWIRSEEQWVKLCRDGITNKGNFEQGALFEANFDHNKALVGEFRDWKDLWGSEKGKTCAMLCPGPSLLDADVPRDDNTFTMGLNRSITMKPDYYYAMDRRGDPSWVVGDCPNTTFIGATCVSHYATANSFKERVWGENYMSSSPADVYPLATGLCISLCSAMLVAYRLGAKRIDLYGCDFALSGRKVSAFVQEDVRYYFNGDMEAGLKLRPNAVPYPVCGIGGKLVFITWELAVQAAHCTVMARMLVNNGVTVRNLTPRGILWDTWSKHE